MKGAAATTLYGTEAAAGVIQIFTKKGSAGKAKWNFETIAGLQSRAPSVSTARSRQITTCDSAAGFGSATVPGISS